MKPFDPTKPIQTRDGRKARIICTDAVGDQPIIALIQHPKNGSERIEFFDADGTYHFKGSPTGTDLVNIPEKHKRKVWVNFYKNGSTYAHNDKPAADNGASNTAGIEVRIACIELEIEFTEGEGL